MSSVIEFPAERVTARPAPTQIRQGEVIIFTGVQVERGELSAAERTRTTRGTPPKAAADPSQGR